MSPTVNILIFICCLINLSWCAPTNMMVSMNQSFPDTSYIAINQTEQESIQPRWTVNLNCSCTFTTPNPRGSKVIIPGLTVNAGQSDHRCDMKTFKHCKTICASKKNEPLFNVDSRSVGVNITNGVNLPDYLCGLKDRGDLSSMVSITVRLECTEKSEHFELFDSQSHLFTMSPALVDCPVSISTTPAATTLTSIGL